MFKTNLKKKDIIHNLKKETGLSANLLKKITDDIINLILINIKNNNFNLFQIGSFKILKKNKRIGRNPKTKEIYAITERKVISFTPSKNLIKEINSF